MKRLWKAKLQLEVFAIMNEAKDSLRFIDREIILLLSHGMILSLTDITLTIYLFILTRKTVSNISLCGGKKIVKMS